MPQNEVLTLDRAQESASQASVMDQAAYVWHKDLMVLDNYTVYALAGNANNDNLQQRIVEVKEGGRGLKQPVGWTRPFDERTLSTIDVDLIRHAGMRELLRDPDELTARLAGLGFIRAVADLGSKEAHGVPDSIIPPPADAGATTTVQIYSPEGVTTTERLTREAIKLGTETVMTSANRSGEPESTTSEAALEFSQGTSAEYAKPGAVVVCQPDEDKPSRPRGSYPVVLATADRFVISRPGCFDPEVLKAALHGYPIEVAAEPERVKYPDNVLRLQDLPADVRGLKGSEFRLAMLSTLGWMESAN